MSEGDPGFRTDKHGRRLADYPVRTEYGRLLGFNYVGNAVYATSEAVRQATLDEAGELRVPPRERWLSGEFPLSEVGLTPGDYVLYAADEAGPWRALTDAAREQVEDRGVDSEQVLTDGPAAGDPADIVGRLVGTESETATAAAAAELRRLVVDRPVAFLVHLPDLLETLRAYLSGTRAGSTEGGDLQPTTYESQTGARDVAFAVARLARTDPDAVVDSIEQVVDLFDLDRGREEAPHQALLLDILDVVGRRATDRTATALARKMTDETDAPGRVRALNAVYHLEQRYARRDHPLLKSATLRDAVDRAATAPEERVREAAEAVETIHGFHRDGN